MQLFNGITMGIFNSNKANLIPDGNEGGEEGNPYTNSINKVIDIFSDKEISEDEKSYLIEAIKNADDDFFTDLKNNEECQTIQDSLINILNQYKDEDKDNDIYKSLKKLAEGLGLNENSNGTWTKESQENPNNVPQKPEFNFTGELKGINPGENNEIQTGSTGLFNGLTRDADEGNKDSDINLNKTTQTITNQLSSVGELLGNDKLNTDVNLKKVKNGLEQAQTVINYTTPDNVKILQKFISENLTEDEKTEFNKRSFKNGQYDGKFGKGTLKGLNIILKKTGDYITEMKNYLKALNDKENQKELDKIAPKSDVSITKGDVVNPRDLLNNVPDDANVNFSDNKEKEKLNGSGDQTIKVKVDYNGNTKIVDVKVNISDNEDQQKNGYDASKDIDPLTIGQGESAQTYQVIKNNQHVVSKCNLPAGAIFYSTIPNGNKLNIDGGETNQREDAGATAEDTQPIETGTAQDTKSDKEYYLKLNNMIYKVKVDNMGNLCPIATEIDTNIRSGKNNSYVENQVLFQANESCIAYLENKLPSAIKSKCTIGWSNNLNDYNLTSYGTTLTIEPMTIAGDWISSDLSRNLAFLNLTNWILDIGEQHNKNDPNINKKLKIKGIKDDKKERITIKKEDFGLGDATDKELARFKKYNNHEDWEDNWDKKRKNKIYKKI